MHAMNIRGTDSGRDETVDMVRGFALFGILITNAAVLTGVLTSDGPLTPVRLWSHDQALDRIADGVVHGLFTGRFYLLFAILFGYAFTRQLAAARRAGTVGAWRTIRRCGALLVLGAGHAALLWIGDILMLYGILGLVLLLLHRLSSRSALALGAALYLIFCLFALQSEPATQWDHWLRLSELRAGYAGSALDTLGAQLVVAPRFVLLTWIGQGVAALAMFLLGMAAGNSGVLGDSDWLRRYVPGVLWVGLGVGLPVSLMTFADIAGLFRAPGFWPAVQELVNPLMAIAYVVLLIRWSRRRPWLVTWLAPAGRMAATNYLGQSAVLMLLYSGYGAALATRVSAPVVGAIAVITFVAQLVFSRWWLMRYTYGPVEWGLRAVTYRTTSPTTSRSSQPRPVRQQPLPHSSSPGG